MWTRARLTIYLVLTGHVLAGVGCAADVSPIGNQSSSVAIRASGTAEQDGAATIGSSPPFQDPEVRIGEGENGPLPEAPRALVDISLPAVTGRSIRVRSGDDLQAAIDKAEPGDEIVLDAGATFIGPIILRKKAGSSDTRWITIRSSGTLPPPGTRVTPAHTSQMGRIASAGRAQPALRTEPGASHYRLIGLEVATAARGRTHTLIELGDGSKAQNSYDKVPHDLVLDRMYIHGAPEISFQRCVGLNSAATAVIDSYLDECHAKGFDSQAIGGWNGPGPYKIVNNYLAGAGENIMFGGADPHIQGLTPSDIEIRRNHIIKPLSWKGRWTVKNLFELKHAQRVLFEANILENNWADAQVGFAVQLTPLSDNNSAPWTRVMDVAFQNNIIRNSSAGINISARNAYGANAVMPEEPAQRIRIYNNLLTEIGKDTNGRLFQLLGELEDIRIEHNTGFGTHAAMILDGQDPQRGLVVENNIFANGKYGVFSSKGMGSAAFANYAPGASFTGNVLIGGTASKYPAGNYFPQTIGEVGFLNPSSGDYKLTSLSKFFRAGAVEFGADIDALSLALKGVK